MQGHPDWRPTVVITCSLAVVFVVVMWSIRKRSSSDKSKRAKEKDAKEDEEIEEIDTSSGDVDHEVYLTNDNIPELPYPNWVKVGEIQELYAYPLKSGRGKAVKECDFTEFGISIESKGRFTLRDRMFLVYNEETGRFQTGRQYPTLILVSLSAVDETKVKLEAVGMPSMVFTVPKCSDESPEAVQCTMWWGEPVKCIDCGSEPAEWLSRFLTGTNSGLRLGCAMMNKRNITDGPWENYTKVYKTLRNEDTGLFSDLASYMLMTTRSVELLNEKLEIPVPALQFRPNILVSTEKPFEDDNWEWIKIGRRAVIRNVKPCTRCKFIRVNPESGIMDEQEPSKTLKTFRELMDPERVKLEGKVPTIGILCGLYLSGRVNIGDEVFVHVPDNSSVETRQPEETAS
ncbi:mitochondrial amidoxime-reducing component 1-like isoform X1 [Hylaeus anthracinus]|uniref:mitochondrial amidoxime-reducing component 1-like isoform X1 n=1 Tax=Hylaeus anthracinus TaxID=313031 RepID=UPI0023B96AA5|nr:mitochondrial amidoxime-reducing component 1-like isoform X1 [Hylaeus anthracinus]